MQQRDVHREMLIFWRILTRWASHENTKIISGEGSIEKLDQFLGIRGILGHVQRRYFDRFISPDTIVHVDEQTE